MCRPNGRHVFLKGKVQMITYLPFLLKYIITSTNISMLYHKICIPSIYIFYIMCVSSIFIAVILCLYSKSSVVVVNNYFFLVGFFFHTKIIVVSSL